MTYQPTNAELYSVIQRLCGKIENLENKLDKLNQNGETNIDKIRHSKGLDTPDVYSNWISFIKVENKHYDSLFTQYGCIITTFKDIVLQHINLSDNLPLYKHKRSVYVYQTTDDETDWRVLDNDYLTLIVKQVWQKLLAIQLNVTYDGTDYDDILDQRHRVVLQMRGNICDKKCNMDCIMKWIKEVL
jgi:hypothetical protein